MRTAAASAPCLAAHRVKRYLMDPMRAAGYIIVATTLPSRRRAVALARSVIKARLAACAHLAPIRSLYWWQGKLEEGREVSVQFKTRGALAAAITALIRSRHPYDVPEIVITPILAGWPDYLGWIDRETSSRPPPPRRLTQLTFPKRRPRKTASRKARTP